MASVRVCIVSLSFVLLFVPWTSGAVGDVYFIGTGRYDITGPAVETEMVRSFVGLNRLYNNYYYYNYYYYNYPTQC